MVYRKLWEIRESRTGGLRLTAAVTCLALLLFACQGTALANDAAARRAWGGGVPSILSRELASIQSLEDILQTAVANNQSVKIAELGIQEALAGGREVNAALRPQLNLTAQHTHENLANSPAILGEIWGRVSDALDLPLGTPIPSHLYEEQQSTTIGTLSYYQQLAPTPQIRGFQDQAEIGADLALLAREQALCNTITSVQERFFNVIRAHNARLAALAARDHAELNLQAAEEKADLGIVTPLDVLKERNSYLEAENNLQDATTGLELAVLALLQSMGLAPVDGETALAWADYLAQGWEGGIAAWQIQLDEAYAYAIDHKLELAMARKQLEMAESAYKAVKDERDWTVTLAGQYQPDDEVILRSSIDSNFGLMAAATKVEYREPDIDLRKLLDELGMPGGMQLSMNSGGGQSSGKQSSVDPWQVELSFSYRFGDGGARRAQLDAKAAALEKVRLQLELAKDGCYLELHSHLQGLDQARRAYELAVEGEWAAWETLEQLESLYELGSVTGKEVREGRLLVIQAENRVLDAALAYEAAKAKLAAAMGVAPEALIAAVASNQWDGLMDN